MPRAVKPKRTPEYLPPALACRELSLPAGSLYQIRCQGKFLLPNLITNVVQRHPQLGWDAERVRRWGQEYRSWESRQLRARLPRLEDAPAWWHVPLLVAPSFADIVGFYEPGQLTRVLRAAAKGQVPAPLGKIKRTYAWHLADAAAVAAFAGMDGLDPRVAEALEDHERLTGFPEQWHLGHVNVPGPHRFSPLVGDPGACNECTAPVQAHREGARTMAQQLEQARAEITAARAAMKDVAQDVQGLMYELGPEGLRLRDYVATADTNGDPEYADVRAWQVRGQLGDLLDWLDNPHAPAEKE